MTEKTIVISLCTNDSRGNDTGKICAVQIGEAIDLQWSHLGAEPRYSIKDGWLHFSRRIFPIISKKDWFGNWCWTAVTMAAFDACEFLNYLRQDDRWHLEGGWCDLTDAYERGELNENMMAEVEIEA